MSFEWKIPADAELTIRQASEVMYLVNQHLDKIYDVLGLPVEDKVVLHTGIVLSVFMALKKVKGEQ